jgi:hypothetical protein
VKVAAPATGARCAWSLGTHQCLDTRQLDKTYRFGLTAQEDSGNVPIISTGSCALFFNMGLRDKIAKLRALANDSAATPAERKLAREKADELAKNNPDIEPQFKRANRVRANVGPAHAPFYDPPVKRRTGIGENERQRRLLVADMRAFIAMALTRDLSAWPMDVQFLRGLEREIAALSYWQLLERMPRCARIYAKIKEPDPPTTTEFERKLDLHFRKTAPQARVWRVKQKNKPPHDPFPGTAAWFRPYHRPR